MWWEDYTARNDTEIDNNPSPGNRASGLTTILEKSLGGCSKRRYHQPRGHLSVRRADHCERIRLHGYAGLRRDLSGRDGGGPRQHHLLHHRSWLCFRVQTSAQYQTGKQYTPIPTHGGGYGYQLRHHCRWGSNKPWQMAALM